MEISEWVTKILESSLESQETFEVISTEEMLAKIDPVNQNWQETGSVPNPEDVTVASLDAEALYPSLDVQQCSKLCGQLIRDSQMSISGVDYKWAGLYVALNCT